MKLQRPLLPLVFIAACACGLSARASGTLKVCADPDYMPYSNRAGQGFENDLARYVAHAMGEKVKFVWADSRGQGGYSEFLSRNLDAGKCDVVMSLPYANQEELTTDPYYVSSYVMVFKKHKGYDLHSLNSPELRKLKIGFETDTPVETGLQLRGMVRSAKRYDVGGHSGVSPETVLKAVQDGDIDVMLTWQPAIGAYLSRFPDLTTVRLPNSRATGSPEMYSFPMSMAVRQGDKPLQKRLDAVIKKHRADLDRILRHHGVELVGYGRSGADASGYAGL
jgi:mxaJ protein